MPFTRMHSSMFSVISLASVIALAPVSASAIDLGGTLGGVGDTVGGSVDSVGGGFGGSASAGAGANSSIGGVNATAGARAGVGGGLRTNAGVRVSIDDYNALRSIKTPEIRAKGLTRVQSSTLARLDLNINEIVVMLNIVVGLDDRSSVVAALNSLPGRERSAVVVQCRTVMANAGLFSNDMRSVCSKVASGA